jgi:hypothetical protein
MKFFENAFKRTKSNEKTRKSGRVWMPVGVPNCERKRPIFGPSYALRRVFSQKTRVNVQKEEKKRLFFS